MYTIRYTYNSYKKRLQDACKDIHAGQIHNIIYNKKKGTNIYN